MSNLYFDAESVKKAKCENNLTRNNKTIRHHKVQSIKNVVIADNNISRIKNKNTLNNLHITTHKDLNSN